MTLPRHTPQQRSLRVTPRGLPGSTPGAVQPPSTVADLAAVDAAAINTLPTFGPRRQLGRPLGHYGRE